MKVLLVTSLERGGPIEQALLLSRGLAKLGASVLVSCASAPLAERFATDGVRAEVVPLAHQGDLLGAARTWRLARGADVVHAHDRRAGLFTRLGPRPRANGIRVYTVHGLPEPYLPEPAGEARPGWRARLLYGGLDARLCARADAIVVSSHALERELVSRLGYPASKVCVIPNGIQPPPPAAADERGELIGTLSLLEAVKGLDIFLRAAAKLAPRHPSWRFALFGTGSEAQRLTELASELQLNGRVERPGFVPAAAALPRLRVYVLCSHFENAPLALLEAMAGGVPVVASAVGGIPEIADDSVARLVPPGDPVALACAIERACEDEAGTEARVQAARLRVRERFSAQRNAEAIWALYERLLGARRR
jgi:glycosyltransferase involved in cell wall biosynthesis